MMGLYAINIIQPPIVLESAALPKYPQYAPSLSYNIYNPNGPKAKKNIETQCLPER